MYKESDIVVYGTEGVCRIQGTTEKKFDGKTIQYYILTPIYKETETVYVPIGNERSMSKMRHVLSLEEAKSLVESVPQEPMEWVKSDRERQKLYRDILLYGTSKDILLMTRTLYLHRLKQIEHGKKLHASDERFMKEAEKMLFQELAYVFGIKVEDVLPLLFQAAKTAQR